MAGYYGNGQNNGGYGSPNMMGRGNMGMMNSMGMNMSGSMGGMSNGMQNMGGMSNMGGMQNMGMQGMGGMSRGQSNFGQHSRYKGNKYLYSPCCYDENDFKVRFMISMRAVGSVIGKGGDRIKSARDNNPGSKIQVDFDEYPERIISILADSREAVVNIMNEITENINTDFMNEPTNKRPPIIMGRGQKKGGPDEMQICMLLNENDCEAVIGRKGEKIKYYLTDAGCSVYMHSDYNQGQSCCLPGSNEKVVTITGAASQIPVCINKMLGYLSEDGGAYKGVVRNWDMKQMGPCGFFGHEATWKGDGMAAFKDRTNGCAGIDPFIQRLEIDGTMPMVSALVNLDQMGIIMGSRGCRIQEIRSMSGADIQVTDLDEDSCLRKVSIKPTETGGETNVRNAIWLIEIVINAFCDAVSSAIPFPADATLQEVVMSGSYGQPPGLSNNGQVEQPQQNIQKLETQQQNMPTMNQNNGFQNQNQPQNFNQNYNMPNFTNTNGGWGAVGSGGNVSF